MPQVPQVSQTFARGVQLFGLLGILLGLVLGFLNQDALGWSLLRASGLGVLFALAARWTFIALLRAWVEARCDSIPPSKSTAISPVHSGLKK